MTVIKCAWAYVAVGGMALKCLRALRNSFLTTKCEEPFLHEKKVYQTFRFNIEEKENYIPITVGIYLFPFFHSQKTKSNLTTWNLNPWTTFKAPFSKWDIPDYWTGVLFSVHQQRWQFWFQRHPSCFCVCMLSCNVPVYTQVIYRICMILAWFRS